VCVALCSPFILCAGTISNFDRATLADNTWSNPANWDNGVPGSSSSTANIGILASDGVQSAFMDVSEIIGGLNVGAGSSLGFQSNSAVLTLGDPVFGGGALNNAGAVNLGSFGTLILSSAGAPGNFTSGGTIDLGYFGTIQGQSGSELLTAPGTIRGTGVISNLTLQPGAGQTLTLDESPATGRSGTLYIDPNTTLATNGGSVILNGSNLNLSLENRGALDIGAGDTFTFRGDGTSFSQFQLGNDGAININNGTLKLDSNGGTSSAFEIGGVSSSGTIALAGGTIAGATLPAYFSNYTGSTLRGNGTIASNLSFANVGSVVASGGTLLLGNSLDYDSATKTLSTQKDLGTFTAGNGAILQFGNMAAGTGIVTNASHIVLSGTGTFENAAGNNALSGFLTSNSGSLTLQDGASLSLSKSFTNTGNLSVQAGSQLDLSHGFANVDSGGSLNKGTYTIGGALLYNGANITAIGSTANLTLDGAGVIANAAGGNHNALAGSLATNNGTLTLENGADLALTQAFTNKGALNVLAGSILDLTSGGFANVTAAGALNGGAYTIGGTLRYNGPAITAIGFLTGLALDGAGSIVNGSNQDRLAGSLATNYGALTLQNGANLALTTTFTNYGYLNVLANSTLDLTGGTFANDAGGVLNTGTYLIGGTLKYNGPAIAAIGFFASLTLDGAGRIGNGSNQDQLANSLARNSGALTLQNGADLALSQNFTNSGRLNVLANSTLDLTAGGFANVNNQGVLAGGTYLIGGTLEYSGQDIRAIGSTASVKLNGNGVIVNTTGSNPDALSGSLATNSGRLALQNGAELNLSQTFTNQGHLNIQAASVLDLTGGGFGNVDGSGVLKGGTYTIGGYLNYSGADIVALGSHTSLTLNGSGAAINNYATGNSASYTLATNDGKLKLAYGAQINQLGTFTNNGSVKVFSGSGLVAGSIINSGFMTIRGGKLTSVESGLGFANTGAVLVESGTSLTVDTGIYTQTSGFTEIDGTLNAAEVDVQGGSLRGAGTIDGTLLNEGGTVAPGDAPGVLTVTDFTQTSGDLLFDIDGTLAGVDYSQLLVTNAATFGGDIEFDFAKNFVPQSNQTYTLIQFGSSTGSFAGYTIENLPAGYTADIIYGAGDVQVSFSPAVSVLTTSTPEPASIALMLAGLGVIAFARRRSRR
jgi:fibronectin-binding autotransporter adhesin